jgi:diketogulonate reductase-like aldo/keto reductase
VPTIPIGVDTTGTTVMEPLVGVGTSRFKDHEAYESVCKAFLAGYTMVDIAWSYKNQQGVGRAIRDCWMKRGRKRTDLFVMTKVPGGLTREQVWIYHTKNLVDLGLSYVDHLMVHFPGDKHHPEQSSRETRQKEWNALQEIYASGQTRSIGVSHYCSQHLDDVVDVSDTVKPSVNQVGYHVGYGNSMDDLIQKCRQHNITFVSYSPLCGNCDAVNETISLTGGELVNEIAANYENVTGAQVSLRFIVQQALEEANMTGGMGGVIPRSNSLEHLRQNLDLFTFELSETEMQRLHDSNEPAPHVYEIDDCDVP